jgi:hypothetical protein
MEENIPIEDHSVMGIGANFWNFNEIRIEKL